MDEIDNVEYFLCARKKCVEWTLSL